MGSAPHVPVLFYVAFIPLQVISVQHKLSVVGKFTRQVPATKFASFLQQNYDPGDFEKEFADFEENFDKETLEGTSRYPTGSSPVLEPGFEAGLSANFYMIKCSDLWYGNTPQLSNMVPVDTVTIKDIGLNEFHEWLGKQTGSHSECQAVRWVGKMFFANPGEYTFDLIATGKSTLSFTKKALITAESPNLGEIGQSTGSLLVNHAGWKWISLDYFMHGFRQMRLKYAGPDTLGQKRVIPANVMECRRTALDNSPTPAPGPQVGVSVQVPVLVPVPAIVPAPVPVPVPVSSPVPSTPLAAAAPTPTPATSTTAAASVAVTVATMTTVAVPDTPMPAVPAAANIAAAPSPAVASSGTAIAGVVPSTSASTTTASTTAAAAAAATLAPVPTPAPATPAPTTTLVQTPAPLDKATPEPATIAATTSDTVASTLEAAPTVEPAAPATTIAAAVPASPAPTAATVPAAAATIAITPAVPATTVQPVSTNTAAAALGIVASTTLAGTTVAPAATAIATVAAAPTMLAPTAALDVLSTTLAHIATTSPVPVAITTDRKSVV